MFYVTKKRCKNCLFSDQRIVSEERKENIITSCIEDNSFFICHQSSIEGGQVCCRGFFDKYRKFTKVIAYAEYLGIVEFVEVSTDKEFASYRDQIKNN